MRVFFKSGLVAAGSIAASILISGLVVPGQNMFLVDGMALFMCIVCPLVIAWPASAYTFWQRDKLARTLGELKQAHAELAAAHVLLSEKARRDDMTGMLNREAFFTAIENARRHSDRGTLLIVDADNFKHVNDTFGHLTGDAALLEISAAIGRSVRDKDLVGRIGGEEFAVYLIGADHQESLQVAERIRSEVANIEFAAAPDERISLSVSIGGAFHRAASALTDLMREADRRLYEAKKRGRNRVIFTGISQAA